MNCPVVIFQKRQIQFSLSTFITFCPCSNAMLHPHVTKVRLPPREQGRAVWIFTSKFGRSVNTSLVIYKSSVALVYFSAVVHLTHVHFLFHSRSLQRQLFTTDIPVNLLNI